MSWAACLTITIFDWTPMISLMLARLTPPLAQDDSIHGFFSPTCPASNNRKSYPVNSNPGSGFSAPKRFEVAAIGNSRGTSHASRSKTLQPASRAIGGSFLLATPHAHGERYDASSSALTSLVSRCARRPGRLRRTPMLSFTHLKSCW